MSATLSDTTIPAGANLSTTSDTHVLVVGAGFGGLAAAIECRRKGFKVTLLESFRELKPLGDLISFGGNGVRVIEKWGDVPKKMHDISSHADRASYYDYTGRHIYTQVFADERQWGGRYDGHRGEFHQVVWDHALSQGVDIRLGHRVEEYFETDEGAGVIVNGEKFTADVVIAADGVKSVARKIVLGVDDKPESSGYAVYRAWYPASRVASNPRIAHLVEGGDKLMAWLGPDVHFIFGVKRGGQEVSWVMTHKDEADVEESWSYPGKIEDALAVVDGWADIVKDIISTTPADRLVDWKLVYREVLPTWVSPKARIVIIGDAAHPFLPTSIQGASQAVEDGAALAACLDIAGKEKITEALRVFEKMRHQRVLKTQATGITTRDSWHKADFMKIHDNPSAVKLPWVQWILGFDAEAHAYNVYADTLEQLEAEKKETEKD